MIMYNNFLKNKTMPWQEQGNWYKVTMKIVQSGSNYYWSFDPDKSDSIFVSDDVNTNVGIAISATNSGYALFRNSANRGTIELLDVHRGKVRSNATTASSATQSSSNTVAALVPDNGVFHIYPGITANSTQLSNGLEIELYLFINFIE